MKYKYLLIFAIVIAILGACNNRVSSQFTGQETLDKDASYALGMNIGADLKEGMSDGNIIPDIDEFLKGLRDVMTDSNTRIDTFEALNILNRAFETLQEKQFAKAEQQESTFLAENARKPGITITASGLQYEIITEGSGPKPGAEDTVLVNYRATFSLTMNMGKLGEHPTCVCFAHHTSHLTLLRVEPETP